MTYTEKLSLHRDHASAPLATLRASIGRALILYLSLKGRRGGSASAIDATLYRDAYATLSALLELWRIRTGEFVFRIGCHLVEIEDGPEPGFVVRERVRGKRGAGVKGRFGMRPRTSGPIDN